MRWWKQLWTDECGAIVSAEVALLATLGVVGATAGLNMVRSAVNDELKDVAYALRSLDQSYEFEGYSNCKASVAGSSFRQRPVAESLKELCELETRDLPKDHGVQPLLRDPLPQDKGPKFLKPADPNAPVEKKPEQKKPKKQDDDDDDGSAEGPLLAPPDRSLDA